MFKEKQYQNKYYKICTNISEKKVLNHDLNIHEVEVVTSESNANGNSKIKILIRI